MPNRVEVTLLGDDPALCARFDTLIKTEPCLKNNQLVSEQLRYVTHVEGERVALLSRSAAAYHLEARDVWIDWSNEPRRRRLLSNNSRSRILLGVDCPNLATRVLALNTARLNAVLPAPLQAVEAKVLPRAEVKIEALRRLGTPAGKSPSGTAPRSAIIPSPVCWR